MFLCKSNSAHLLIINTLFLTIGGAFQCGSYQQNNVRCWIQDSSPIRAPGLFLCEKWAVKIEQSLYLQWKNHFTLTKNSATLTGSARLQGQEKGKWLLYMAGNLNPQVLDFSSIILQHRIFRRFSPLKKKKCAQRGIERTPLGVSYNQRPVLEFLNNLWGPMYRVGIGLSYRLAELIPWNPFLGSLKV